LTPEPKAGTGAVTKNKKVNSDFTGLIEGEKKECSHLDLSKIFNPERIAVIGVSMTNQFHPANIIYNKNYYGYECETYGVNPKGGELEHRRIYRSVREIFPGSRAFPSA